MSFGDLFILIDSFVFKILHAHDESFSRKENMMIADTPVSSSQKQSFVQQMYFCRESLDLSVYVSSPLKNSHASIAILCTLFALFFSKTINFGDLPHALYW